MKLLTYVFFASLFTVIPTLHASNETALLVAIQKNTLGTSEAGIKKDYQEFRRAQAMVGAIVLDQVLTGQRLIPTTTDVPNQICIQYDNTLAVEKFAFLLDLDQVFQADPAVKRISTKTVSQCP